STHIMSDSEAPDPDPKSLSIHFSVKLVLVVEVPGSKNKKGKLKTTKETRTKVFTLPIDNSTSSYERLLQTIIDKHNQPFKISAQRPYIFQCVVGGNSSSSGQTMDIETYTEFQEMVELLQDEERAKKAKLTVELEKIKKAAQRRLSEGTLRELEKSIAKRRCKLEKKYASGPGGTGPYIYTYQDGHSLTLTPFMLREWAIGLEENIATLNEPPNTPSFDIANKQPELCNRTKSGGAATNTPGPATESLVVIAQLATSVLDFAKQLAQPPHSAGVSPMTVPNTPKRQRTELRPDTVSPSSLPPPSPSDIPRFLKYAKDNLGIKDAACYVDGLRDKHLGPDILDQADIQELTGFDISMPYGDALRLRAAAPSWWKSRTKRAREDFEGDPTFTPIPVPVNPTLHIRVNYPDGGEASYWVPSLIRGDQREHDHYTQYYDGESKTWLPIPEGWTAPKLSE
ncbi:hypothetical protein EDB86DRAFT_2813883, partial [Lactarius hatsudake]